MKKSNRKLIFIVVMALASSLLFTSVQAQIIPTRPLKYTECEYTYTGMTEGKAAMIIDSWGHNASGDHNAAPMSILCIFGHNKAEGTITQTYHNISPKAPKCKKICSEVEYCTRSSCTYSKVLNEVTYNEYCH